MMDAIARRRRMLFFGLTLISSLLASLLMLDILRANSLTVLEAMSLVLFFGLFTWIAGAFWTAIAGFIIRLKGGDPRVMQAHDADGLVIHSRIALVMPVYNEDPRRTTAGLEAIWSSLAKQAESAAFDLFILSDTRKSDIAVAEEAAWRALVARHGGQGRIFYRRRAQNVGRKSGNIADFVRNWGAAYSHMIVLDADSVMSGKALVTLARLMDANPQVGIIQTAPLPVGRETLFARMVQFGARLNGPMLSSGLAFWQLGEANYWGHNAIIRLHAFAAHCDLPRLPGQAPLGGEILSHDFVEAAFMRRAGYQVWLVPDLMGSWEEVPSNIIEFAARDRRWAQGNLQHMKVLIMPQLHWLNRLHMVTGILSYATSPMWFAVLILSSIITCQEAIQGYQYFETGAHTLFPVWPEYRDGEIAALLLATIVVLLLPKVLGATLAFVNGPRRRAYGGGIRLLLSLVLEQIFSMLLAPIMMVFHSTFVITTLAGKPVTWNAQDRGDRGVTLGDALGRHVWQILLGIIWGTVILMLAPRFIWWMIPVLAGLLLSAFLTMVSSRVDLGVALRRHGLLLTPEESSTPPELAAMQRALRHSPAEIAHAGADLALVVRGDTLQTPALAPLRMEAP
ncbi:MAG TPA: glucans biosynthesis glucosyltransferase MdoH [Steroidobacteraceae bacterium]|jgi:membrane glycosyltransferase|nr:glucans biosynthesis glucosyltransferase MdoH [Steroidobacteraceae bacterium]